MDKLDANRWHGKSPEDVLIESFHDLRNPITILTGYLNVLKSADWSEEKTQQFLDLALNYAMKSKEVVDSVFDYINEHRRDQ